MKTYATTLFIWCLVGNAAFAQVPQSISYQAVARDASGNCLENETISLQISILQGSPTGAVVYRERFEGNVNTNSAGHFQIAIGTGNPQSGAQTLEFNKINWINQTFFLKVEYAPGSNTNFQEVGTTQLLSVPYAMAAGNGKLFASTNKDEHINFYGTNGSTNASIGGQGLTAGTNNDGIITVRDGTSSTKVYMESEPTADGSFGRIATFGPNGNSNISITTDGQDRNFGALSINNENGEDRVYINSEDEWQGAGRVHIKGANGNSNVWIGTDSENRDYGAIRIYDAQGSTRVLLYSEDGWEGAGRINTYGPNGTKNSEISIRTADCPNHGLVYVYDDAGTAQAGMRVNCDDKGEIFADIKNFVMPHPTKPDKEIVYACIEGPEAAAYERGTVTLVNGEAEVFFSESFEIVANPETMTVMTSPWSAESQGLAVVERTAKGFRIKELAGGTGNYKVDWEAKAVRKGWENYEVIRDAERETEPFVSETPQNQE